MTEYNLTNAHEGLVERLRAGGHTVTTGTSEAGQAAFADFLKERGYGPAEQLAEPAAQPSGPRVPAPNPAQGTSSLGPAPRAAEEMARTAFFERTQEILAYNRARDGDMWHTL